MFIFLNIKKNSIYFLLFMPFSLFIAVLDTFINNMENKCEFINAISQISISLFYFYEEYTLKKYIQNKKQRNVYFNTKKKNSSHSFKIIILLLCSIILYLSHIHLFTGRFYFKGEYQQTFYIFLILLIDGIFFKNYIYAHHYISIFLNFILFCFIFIKLKFTLFCIYFLDSYCYSFHFLLLYYINLKYFINIYLLGTILGISKLIYLIFFTDLITFWEYYKIMILFFFIYFLNYFLLYFILTKEGPIQALFYYYIPFVIMKNLLGFEFHFFVNIFFIIPGLIYLEIIELHFCELDKNLKKNISLRELQEITLIQNECLENSIII